MSVRQASGGRKALTPQERETIVRFDETDAPASVFTYNWRWQEHIGAKLGIKPSFKNTKGGKDYELPKKAIRLPQIIKRKVTAETRARLQAQLAAARAATAHKKQGQGTGESVLAGSGRRIP